MSGHVDPSSGRVKLMWQNREQQADGSIRARQCKLTADSMVEARELAVQIAAALREKGWWQPGEAAFRPAVENLDLVFQAYLRHKTEFERVRPNTSGNIAYSFGRFTRGVRALLGLGDEEMIPAEALTLPLYRRWVEWAGREGKRAATRTEAAQGYGPGTIYQTAHIVLDAWAWATRRSSSGSPGCGCSRRWASTGKTATSRAARC